MKAITFSIVLALFFFFSACSEDSPTNSSLKTYKYTSYDSTGNKIISGYLWIDSVDSTIVKGRWEFSLIGNCENVGPQLGKGNFDGVKDSQGNMSLNLNPEWIDNNVLLCGSKTSYHYNGVWNYIGFPGLINSGTFQATQQ